ncbi:hypothetical protein Bca101_009531 [Brassica carinata]
MGETGGGKRWNFGANEVVELSCSQNVPDFMNLLADNLDRNDTRPVVPLAHGDPSPYPSFRTDPTAVEAVCDALRFNHYSTSSVPLNEGLSRAVAEHLSQGLSYQICPNHAVEALADDKTAAILVVNPSNPCGNIAETASKLGILVIADEVYRNITFGETPFVSMVEFAETVPVMVLGSISKRWAVPGWRFGWMVTLDPHNIMKDSGLVHSLANVLNMSTDPTTFIQGAIPDILEKTTDEFFSSKLEILRECSETCYQEIKKIPCITCPYKPEASMFTMVKLEFSVLEDIKDDLEFCCKLAKEESLIILPGRSLGLKNWLRISFAVEPELLKDGLSRLSNFAQRHSKKQQPC